MNAAEFDEIVDVEVNHPVPGARAGEVIAVGRRHRWVAYGVDGTTVAACYIAGRLLRRDVRGWWEAGFGGDRQPVPDRTVAAIVGTAPTAWPMLSEQAPLLGADLLGVPA